MDLLPIKNMAEASDYIGQLSRQTKIVIYGDEDVDGVSSVIIIKESLERLGFSSVKPMFCWQEKEGHGFSLEALESIKSIEPTLLILVDLGITNVDSVNEARRGGIEVIIIDHHEPLNGTLPKANFIINPKQPQDDYYFKQLAAAGLSYHFSCWLLHRDPDFNLLRDSFVELAGLATLADMMPLEEDNRPIVDYMLDILPGTGRVSLRFLMERYINEEIGLKEALHRVIGILNASEVDNQRMAESFLLLTEGRLSRIEKMVKHLEEKMAAYLRLKEEIAAEAEQRLSAEEMPDIIFIGDESWPRRVLAAVAARLADNYHRPVFIYHQGVEISRGSVRSPEGINCVALMSACSHHLIKYGGHPPAAGFQVRNENLQKLRLCLIENYRKLYGQDCCLH